MAANNLLHKSLAKISLATTHLHVKMAPEECFAKFDAGLIRERLLADYVDIWKYIFESDGFTGWAYDDVFSRLYVHAAPQCGKVSA